MSSILKALKKLEEEKAVRREGPLDLPHEILQSRRARRSFAPLVLGGAFALILLLTIALTVLVMTRNGDHHEVAPPGAPVKSIEETSGSSAGTGTPAGAVKRGGGVSVAPQKTVAENPRQRVPVAAEMLPPPAPVATIPPEERSAGDALPPLPAPAPAQPAATARKEQPAMTAEPSEAALTVSGIAWNKDSADRLAIINGQPTATGGAVNGFRVDEILPDRVRFSSNGKTIEIFIGKSGKNN